MLDRWTHHGRKSARGTGIIVRYADDFVLGFEEGAEAERDRRDLEERRPRFGWQLHPEKTRRIEFGRRAVERRQQQGLKRPDTFTFLGFRHWCGKGRKGRFLVQRKTIGKRLRRKLREIRGELMRRRHDPIPIQGAWVRSVVSGYFRYQSVPGNSSARNSFRRAVCRHWKWALTRRSQKGRMPWKRFHR